jgi:Lysine 2,3-aminomutase
MIPETEWQEEISSSIRNIDELAQRVQLSIADLDTNKLLSNINPEDQHTKFPLRVTESYLRRVEVGNSKDPLLLQILPTATENLHQTGYSLDPVGDCSAQKQDGVIQKYHGRALLITTPACAIHCRYCFRRHYPYSENRISDTNLAEAIEWIKEEKSLNEIILSGGDPMMLSNQRLFRVIDSIAEIPHIKTVRIHTRMPVVLPSRIDDMLIDRLSQLNINKVVVIHANHPNEINSEVESALLRIKQSGTILLNQSVLLKGVNDSASTLKQLSLRLFDAGVIPYYLHTLDRVVGSHHFEVRDEIAV